MIYERVDKQDLKSEMIVHIIVAIIWIAACVVGIIFRERLSWVVAVIAVGYLAIDELANVFFFFQKYKKVRDAQKDDPHEE